MIRSTRRLLGKLLLKSIFMNKLLAHLGLITDLSPYSIRSLIGTAISDAPMILDIGANDGAHSRIFAEIFQHRAEIHSFEPDPRAIKRFKESANSTAINLHEIVLGNHNGPVHFHQSSGWPDDSDTALSEGWDYSGSIRRPKNVAPWLKFDQVIEVECITLDNWSGNQTNRPIDFIWMDVQGAEGDVILGGTQTLERTRFLYMEYSNREEYEGQLRLDDILKLLPNWEILILFPGDVLLANKAFGG